MVVIDFVVFGVVDYVGFIYVVWGEVVLQYEVVLVGIFQGIDELGIVYVIQGGGDDCLGFILGEQC